MFDSVQDAYDLVWAIRLQRVACFMGKGVVEMLAKCVTRYNVTIILKVRNMNNCSYLLH